MEVKSMADWGHVTKWVTDEEAQESLKNLSGSSRVRVEYYNSNAETYDHDMMAHLYSGPRKVAETLHKYMQGRPGLKILDVGGGTGFVTSELKKLGSYDHIECVDPAEKMLQISKDRGIYTQIYPQYFHVGSGLPNDYFDAVMTCGVFMPGHMKAASLKEMCQLTKPGGYVVVGMREDYQQDPDLAMMKQIARDIQAEGKWNILEEFTYDGFYDDFTGQMWVFQKC